MNSCLWITLFELLDPVLDLLNWELIVILVTWAVTQAVFEGVDGLGIQPLFHAGPAQEVVKIPMGPVCYTRVNGLLIGFNLLLGLTEFSMA